MGSTAKDTLAHMGGVPLGGREAIGMGQVYYVIQTTAYLYDDAFMRSKDGFYKDGTARVHTTIQAALACVKSLRNDYVILVPDHLGYTITAALDLRYQMCFKFLCPPAYSGYDVGCNRLAPITQSTTDTAIIPLTGHHCEVAGITFVNAASDATATGSAISAAANCGFYSNVHHNLFEMYTSGGTNIPIIGNATSGMAWSRIHRNKFIGYSGASTTMAKLISIAANATGVDVDHNYISIGDGNTVTLGIANYSVKGSVKYNTFNEAGAAGGMSAGTFGDCIAVTPAVGVIGNRGAVATGNLLTGGTSSNTYCDNQDAVSGGASVEA